MKTLYAVRNTLIVIWYYTASVIPGTVLNNYSITENPNTIFIVKAGQDLNITCVFDLDANFTSSLLIWYKGDEIVSKEEVDSSGTYFRTIEDPQFEDSDIYSCGMADIDLIETVTIWFGALPRVPTFKASSTDRTNIFASLEPGLSSNLPTQYKLEYKHEYFNGCQYSVEYQPCQNWNSCVIEDAFLCSKFIFQLTATNFLVKENPFVKTWIFDFYDDTIPNAPANVNGVIDNNTGSNWIITWDIPTDWPETIKNSLNYRILYWSDKQTETDILPITVNKYQTSYIIDMFYPFTHYYCRVQAMYNKGWGPWTDVIITLSAEDAPSFPLELKITEHNMSLTTFNVRNILLTWETLSKEHANGIILGYEIIIEWNNKIIMNSTINNTNTTKFFIDNLLYKDQEYSVSVKAFNSVGKSPKSSIHLEAVPDELKDEPSSTNKDAKLAAIVVCVGLFGIILLALFIWHIICELKEAKKIPGIQIKIDELFARSLQDQSHASQSNRGQMKPEIFDALIPDTVPFIDNNVEDLHHENTLTEHISPPNYIEIYHDVGGNSNPVSDKAVKHQVSKEDSSRIPQSDKKLVQPPNYVTTTTTANKMENKPNSAPLNQDTGSSSHLNHQTKSSETPIGNTCGTILATQGTNLSSIVDPYLSLSKAKGGSKPPLQTPNNTGSPYVLHQHLADSSSVCTSGIGSLPSLEESFNKHPGTVNVDYVLSSDCFSFKDDSFNAGCNGYVTNNPTL